jgi:hypothetical protein
VTISYYSGTSPSGTPLSAPPIAVGTYTAVANYSGDSNYLASQSASVTFTISATSGAVPFVLSGPAFYLRLDPDQQHLDVWNGNTDAGSPSQDVLLSNISSIEVSGVSTGTTLNVDFVAGDPLVPSGVTFTGIAGAANVLNMIDSGDSANMAFNVDSKTVDVVSSNAMAPVTYSGVQAINIQAGAGTDALTQLAQPAASVSFLNTTASDSVDVINGIYTIPAGAAGSGIHTVLLNTLDLAAGTKVIVEAPATHSDRAVLILNQLLVAGSANAWTAQLDLSSNDLIVHNGNLAVISNLLRGGFNDGGALWNGQGIASSAANADSTHLTALGAVVNNNGAGQRLFGSGTSAGLFDGQDAVLTDVLVKYTYFGDANLDGSVDQSDDALLEQGFNNHLTGWYNGDFNYDGVIDGADYTLFDNTFNTLG